jgi:hypothetical protein
MRFFLDSILIQLEYSDPDVSDQVNILFHGWQPEANDIPHSSAADAFLTRDPDCKFELEISKDAPDLPEGKPLFQEKSHTLPPNTGFVSIFQQGEEIIIYFHDGAIVKVLPDPIPEDSERKGLSLIQARIARGLLRSGRLEDILFTGLAPFLRRRGYFLAHAFAAARSGESVLLVGPSNSGKTTAGLSLTCGGWGYLANDVVLLKLVGDEVCALPTPGAVGLSAKTINLIPGLESIRGRMLEREFIGKKYLPALDIVSSWAAPAPVKTICFPKIDTNQVHDLRKISKAMTFARLMESSTDRWDQAMLEDHVNLLQCLIEQADGYELRVGDQVADWSESLLEIRG